MSLRGGSSSGSSGGSSSIWSVGGLRVTSLDDISRYADAMVSFLDGGGDGSAEANHIAQGLKVKHTHTNAIQTDTTHTACCDRVHG